MSVEYVVERIRELREQILETAAESLRLNDERMYRGLSEVAVRLTALIPPSEVVSQATAMNQPTPALAPTPNESGEAEFDSESHLVSPPSNIRIFARRRGVTYEAELDTTRISGGGRGECVLYEGQWMTTSRAAGKITGTAVNGWQNFWRYERSDGSNGSIQELRDRQLHSEDELPW